MNFQITPIHISTAKAVTMAMAYVATVKPVVEAYQVKVLKELNFDTTPKRAWELGDEKFNEYIVACHAEIIAAGFKVPEVGYCPLLIAESLLRDAHRAFVDATFDLHNLEADDLICSGLDNYNKLINLTLKFVLSNSK